MRKLFFFLLRAIQDLNIFISLTKWHNGILAQFSISLNISDQKSILRTFCKSDSLNLVCLKPFVPNAPFLIVSLLISPYYPSDIYLVKVNNRNIRASCEIYSKLTIKTPGIVMVSFLISHYYNHQPLLHITQLCNLLFHENFDDFHGACKELKLRIHWRPPTILKASKKVYEVMFLVCKSMHILNVYSIH